MNENKESPRCMQRKLKAVATKCKERCADKLAKVKMIGGSSKSITPSWDSSDDPSRKCRKQIDSYLRRFGNEVGKGIFLGENGICSFQYHNKFVITIDVPASGDEIVYIFALVYQIDSKRISHRMNILQTAMQLNYMHQGTRGCTLGLSGDEIILCFSSSINNLTEDTFIAALDDFMTTADECNRALELSNSSKSERR